MDNYFSNQGNRLSIDEITSMLRLLQASDLAPNFRDLEEKLYDLLREKCSAPDYLPKNCLL